MKILLITNRVPWPLKDGGAIAMHTMLFGLHGQGAEVTLFSLNTPKHYKERHELPKDFDKLKGVYLADINTDVRPFDAFVNLFRAESYNLSRFWNKRVGQQLEALLGKEEFDVVQLEGLFSAPYIDVVKANSSALTVLRAHNAEHLIWQRMADSGPDPVRKWYLNLLAKRLKKEERELVNKCDLLLPISDVDADIFKSLGRKRDMQTVPPGIDLEDYKPDDSQLNYCAVFHIGSLDWLPNLEGLNWFINEVWPLVLERAHNLRFYIAGRNIPDKIRELKRPGVVVVGDVPDAQEFINEHAIMVVPLLSGSGIRIKILEGMALKKAIISTLTGAEGINYKDGRHLIIADKPVEFADAIVELSRDKERIAQLGENARQFVGQYYDNKKLMQNLLEFYRLHFTKAKAGQPV